MQLQPVIHFAAVQFMHLNALHFEKRIDELHNIQPEQAEDGGIDGPVDQQPLQITAYFLQKSGQLVPVQQLLQMGQIRWNVRCFTLLLVHVYCICMIPAACNLFIHPGQASQDRADPAQLTGQANVAADITFEIRVRFLD
ncbi:hypothetical protein D3C73_511170 [compost metagenome]